MKHCSIHCSSRAGLGTGHPNHEIFDDLRQICSECAQFSVPSAPAAQPAGKLRSREIRTFALWKPSALEKYTHSAFASGPESLPGGAVLEKYAHSPAGSPPRSRNTHNRLLEALHAREIHTFATRQPSGQPARRRHSREIRAFALGWPPAREQYTHS